MKNERKQAYKPQTKSEKKHVQVEQATEHSPICSEVLQGLLQTCNKDRRLSLFSWEDDTGLAHLFPTWTAVDEIPTLWMSEGYQLYLVSRFVNRTKTRLSTGMLAPMLAVKSYVWCVIRPCGVSSSLQPNIPAHVRAKTHFSQNCCLGNGELIPKKSMFRGTNDMLSCRFCRPIQLLPDSASSRVPQGVLRNAFQCPAKSPFAFQQWDLWHLRPSTHKGESKCSASTWGLSHQLKRYWSLIVSYY